MKCIVCDKDFAGRKDAKFCSSKCRVTASRRRSVTDTIRNIDKLLAERGLPPVIRGSELPPVTFISSQIPEIDAMTGGFPRKRITEIFGLKGVGKTMLMSNIVSGGLKVFYLDTENAMNQVPQNVDVLLENCLEMAAKSVDAALEDNYDLIVVDSVASLVPRAELEGDEGDMHMGLKARLMGQWMRRITRPLAKSNAAMVFVNQQREAMELYGPKRFTPGGHALPYAASLRLELKSNRSSDKISKGDSVIGHWVNVEVEKSRICKPYQKARFKLLYS